MTDLNTMTKAAINALLAAPLSASALKKTSHADLVAMFDAMPASDALDADIADAPTPEQMLRDESNHWGVDPDAEEPIVEPTPPTEPTLGQVIANLTDLEKRVLVAHLDAGMECNGAETLDAMRADNMTWSDVAETAKRTGLTKKQVNGVLSSLSTKGLVVTDCDPVNGEGAVQQVLDDFGIIVAFELLADGTEAKAPAPAPKPVPAPKARVVEDRVIVAPATDLKMVKPVGEGSKRNLLAEALLIGATVERLQEVTGWNKSTATSALRWDVPQMGLGVERKGDKYFLLFPAGVKAIPVRSKDMTRADALVAACK